MYTCTSSLIIYNISSINAVCKTSTNLPALYFCQFLTFGNIFCHESILQILTLFSVFKVSTIYHLC